MNWLKKMLINKWAGSIARTAAAALAGALLVVGIEPEVIQQFKEVADPIIAGLIIYIATQGMSFLEKKGKGTGDGSRG